MDRYLEGCLYMYVTKYSCAPSSLVGVPGNMAWVMRNKQTLSIPWTALHWHCSVITLDFAQPSFSVVYLPLKQGLVLCYKSARLWFYIFYNRLRGWDNCNVPLSHLLFPLQYQWLYYIVKLILSGLIALVCGRGVSTFTSTYVCSLSVHPVLEDHHDRFVPSASCTVQTPLWCTSEGKHTCGLTVVSVTSVTPGANITHFKTMSRLAIQRGAFLLWTWYLFMSVVSSADVHPGARRYVLLFS